MDKGFLTHNRQIAVCVNNSYYILDIACRIIKDKTWEQ